MRTRFLIVALLPFFGYSAPQEGPTATQCMELIEHSLAEGNPEKALEQLDYLLAFYGKEADNYTRCEWQLHAACLSLSSGYALQAESIHPTTAQQEAALAFLSWKAAPHPVPQLPNALTGDTLGEIILFRSIALLSAEEKTADALLLYEHLPDHSLNKARAALVLNLESGAFPHPLWEAEAAYCELRNARSLLEKGYADKALEKLGELPDAHQLLESLEHLKYDLNHESSSTAYHSLLKQSMLEDIAVMERSLKEGYGQTIFRLQALAYEQNGNPAKALELVTLYFADDLSWKGRLQLCCGMLKRVETETREALLQGTEDERFFTLWDALIQKTIETADSKTAIFLLLEGEHSAKVPEAMKLRWKKQREKLLTP
ncbi:MAG: hypothetical protein JW739_02755 [Opitutales bacterium]|nr:hypothetical protein [Opitutales bacterium]